MVMIDKLLVKIDARMKNESNFFFCVYDSSLQMITFKIKILVKERFIDPVYIRRITVTGSCHNFKACF